MNKFWNWARDADDNDTEERVLYIDGVIAEESWYDDDVTPKEFKRELDLGTGNITLYLNSIGGDCIAASQIYTMLLEYKANVTVKIDGLAASAASVIAMAGSEVLMSPTSMMMIHNPITTVFGDSSDLKKTISMLEEVKESIINAYVLRSSLSRDRISKMMDNETWMNPNKAIEYKFADGLISQGSTKRISSQNEVEFMRNTVTSNIINKVNAKRPKEARLEAKSLYTKLLNIPH